MHGTRVYPREFSAEARNRVESANILAWRELAKHRQTIPSPYPGHTSDEFNRAFLSAVLKVFLVFAEEAVKLSDAGKWSLDRVGRESEEFLRLLVINVRHLEGYDRSGSKVPEMVDNGGELSEWVVRRFREAPEWAQYEALLLGTPDQAVPIAPETSGGVVVDEIYLNESQKQRFLEAEEKLDSSLHSHEQMRAIVDPQGWRPASPLPGGPTMGGEIRKLESDIRKYATTVLSLRAEALWSLNSLEPFRERLEADAHGIVERAFAKIKPSDLPFLDKGSLETAINHEVEGWIHKAQQEFPHPWMVGDPATTPEQPKTGNIRDQTIRPLKTAPAGAASNSPDALPERIALENPTATEISEIKMFEQSIQPLKVRLKRELISPEDALKELRAIADSEQYPVKLRAYILDELDALSETTPARDSAANGLRAALKQKSEKLRREAVAIILDRIMDPPEIKDYQAAKRHSEQLKTIRGHSTEFLMAQQPPATAGGSEPKAFVSRQTTLAAARQAVVMPILAAKGWKRGAWATKAGVGKNCVYEYLAGKRSLSPQNRTAMAQELDLKPNELPK